jgi:hypothetical protein
MLSGVPARRLVAATDVSTRPADSQVHPALMDFEAFFATQCARRHRLDPTQVRTLVFHVACLAMHQRVASVRHCLHDRRARVPRGVDLVHNAVVINDGVTKIK